MKTRTFWMVAAAGLLLLAGTCMPSMAAGADQGGSTQAAQQSSSNTTNASQSSQSNGAAVLTGTIVAYTPGSRTLVVDVPERDQTLRLGTLVTDQTQITQGNQKASFDLLKEGERVRVTFHREDSGDNATSVDILQGRG